MRRTVPPVTTLPGWSDGIPLSAATVPLSTLVTNRYAVLPIVVDVMSQGPLIAPPAHVSTSWPVEFSTRRQPAPMPCGVPRSRARSPWWAGFRRRPTLRGGPTAPWSTRSRPGTVPVVEAWVIWANWVTVPSGISCTMVVPVPCALATSLKLLTSTPPCTRFPVLWGTTTIP